MMQKVRRHGMGVLLALLALFSAAGPAASQEAVVLRITPAQAQVAAGQTIDVAVEVVDVQELYAFDVAIGFDPDVVEVVDANPNQPGIQIALGMLPDAGFVILNQVDNEAGVARLAMTQLNPSTPKSGTGTLIVVTLRGKLDGASTTIDIPLGELAGPDGDKIPLAPPVSGVVSVAASGENTPTATPMPAQGAGTPMPTPLETIPAIPTTAPPAATPAGGPADTPTPEAALENTAPAETTQPANEPTLLAPSTDAAPPPAAQATSAAQPTVTLLPLTQTPPSEVSQAPSTPVSRAATPSTEGRRAGSYRALLWIAGGAMALAILVGAVAIALWLHQRRPASRGSSRER